MSERTRERLEELMDRAPTNVYAAARDDMERDLLTEVMKFTRNNQTQATIILGINRGTLRTKLAKYNLL